MPNLGVWEILLILLVVLIVFGPKRLPEMGRSLGRGMREFKTSITSAVPTEDEIEGQPREDPNAARPVPTVVETASGPAAPAAAATVSAPTAETEGTAGEPAPSSGGQATG